MGLQRYAFEGVDDWVFDGTDEVCVERYDMLPRDYGEYYPAADVDALLARIRAAVGAMDDAWRILAEGEHLVGVCDDDTAELADRQACDDIDATRAALDALLSDGGA